MKYYHMIASSCGVNSKKLSLMPVNPNLIDYFDPSAVELEEPVLVKANYYNKDDREDDYVCAGNPQVVSEEFKILAEELDPGAAQFFTTKSVNCTLQKKYYVMHVTQVVYCLDREHSKILPGIIENKENIALGAIDSSKVPSGVHIFRMGENTSAHYVSETFYKEYKKRKLKGCQFSMWTAK